MTYTEKGIVEDPIIKMLEKIGWEYVPSRELKRDVEEPFDLPTLRESIRRLNPKITSDEQVERVINSLKRVPNDVSGDREFFGWIRGEKSVVLRPGEKATTIQLIDYWRPNNNRFVVTNQLWFAGYERRRLDVILYVNGLPLVDIEAKDPKKYEEPYEEAVGQIFDYHRDVPQFMNYLAFNCPTDGVTFGYGWDNKDRFFEWGVDRLKTKDPLKVAVNWLFDKENFLDLIQNFIVFEEERGRIEKKIAMPHQVRAANKIVGRVLREEPKKGLIWHFQGSGKTLTMFFAAWKLKKIRQLENPPIILVVDRKNLEGQLYGTFRTLPYTDRADSIRDLKEKLGWGTKNVLVTTIQKFRGIERALRREKNLVIFVDEAHRSQYGTLAASMRKALPHAFTFGFTGTPIERGPWGRSTSKVFCPPEDEDGYLDKYSMEDSIRDGATVPIFYDPKWMEYGFDEETLDREFLQITAGLPPDEQEKVLQRSATLKPVLKSKNHIEEVANHVADHFQKNVDPSGFKAMLVAVDREACVFYKEALDKLLPHPEWSQPIFTPSRADPSHMKKYHLSKDERTREIPRVRFQKEGEDPRILIVTEMLLTGFDAPIARTMYLDKPLRDHKLIQAIARTNRPYRDKIGGLVLDYVGIFRELRKALNFQAKDIRNVALPVEGLKKKFGCTISSLLAMFKGVKREDSRESWLKAVRSLIESKRRARYFKEKLSLLKDYHEALAPDPSILEREQDYKWLLEINLSYNRLMERREKIVERKRKTERLIREKIDVGKIEREIPVLKIDENYLSELRKTGYSEQDAVAELRSALDHHIRVNLETNPIYYGKLSEKLKRVLKIIDRRTQRRELEKLVGEVVDLQRRKEELGATDLEYAAISSIMKLAPSKSDAELLPAARKILSSVKGDLFPGWSKKKGVRMEVERKLLDACMEEFGTKKAEVISDVSHQLVKIIEAHGG